MKTTQSTSEKILTRLKSRKGQGVPISDFLDLGNRPAVRQALSRLVRRGAIRRVPTGAVRNTADGQAAESTAGAVARRTGPGMGQEKRLAGRAGRRTGRESARAIHPGSGEDHLLHQRPDANADAWTLLRQTAQSWPPRAMGVRGRTAPLVFQALRYLGREGVTQEVVDRLRSTLSERRTRTS